MALGFNWGTYFSNCNWYFDFAMAYEFQVWWDQNVLMAYMKSDFRNDLGNNNQVPSFVPFDPKKINAAWAYGIFKIRFLKIVTLDGKFFLRVA